MKRKYPSDLTDSQWNHIKDLFPKPKTTGRPREVDFREVVNAILYLVFTGIQWRFMPTDYPKWQTVYYYFSRWQNDGWWYRIHETLRSDLRRKKVGTSIRRQAHLIRNQSRQRLCHHHAALMQVKR